MLYEQKNQKRCAIIMINLNICTGDIFKKHKLLKFCYKIQIGKTLYYTVLFVNNKIEKFIEI